MEKGIVVEAQNNKISVRFSTSEACKKCGACDVGSGQPVMSDIDNTVNATVGDTVFIQNNDNSMLKAASIIYLIPVAAIIGGYFIGSVLLGLIGLAAKYAVLFALSFFFASFFAISMIDKKLADNVNFKPVVVKKM